MYNRFSMSLLKVGDTVMRKWPYNNEKTYYHARVVNVNIETNPDESKRREGLAPKEIELSAVKRLMNMVKELKAENEELQEAVKDLEMRNKRLRHDRQGSYENILFVCCISYAAYHMRHMTKI